MSIFTKVVTCVAVFLTIGMTAALGCALASEHADGAISFVNEVSSTEIAFDGDVQILDCEAVNFCSISWYKDGIPLPRKQQGGGTAFRYLEDKNQFLTFKAVDVTDGGEYTCVASNGNHQLSRTTRLVVIEESYRGAPILIDDGGRGSCNDQTAELGESVRLTCEFYVGKEQLTRSTVGWLKVTKEGDMPTQFIEQDTEVRQEYRNGTVIVAHLQINRISENGFGTWKVYVENGFATEVVLNVNPRPTGHSPTIGATASGLDFVDSGECSCSDGSSGTITLLIILLIVISSLLLLTVSIGLWFAQSFRNRRIARTKEDVPETKRPHLP